MPRFTKAQRGQVEKLVGDVVTSVNPEKENLQEKVLGANLAKLFQKRVREVFVLMLGQYFVPFTDEEALVWLVEQAKQSESAAEKLVKGCRKGALEHGLTNSDPCHYAVEPGATLKQTIPTLGPCVEDLKHLQDWSFPDVPTEPCLVSGVPMVIRESVNQDLATQLRTLAAMEIRDGVPNGFFSHELLPAVYMVGVALAYFNLNKHDMFGGLLVRTGTRGVGGRRLYLDWLEGRLDCDYCHWVEDGDADLGVFALGVTKALGR